MQTARCPYLHIVDENDPSKHKRVFGPEKIYKCLRETNRKVREMEAEVYGYIYSTCNI